LLNRNGALAWSNTLAFSEGADLFLWRDEPNTLAQRFGTNQQAFRIYNTYTDASNYERLSLSATRIDYEFAGTGVKRDLEVGTSIIPTVTHAGDLGSSLKRWGHLYTVYDVVPGRDIAFDANTSRIVFRYYDSGGSSILRSDESNEINQRNATAPQRYRIYNTYTDANNYERLSLSATRIAYECAGTGVSRDLTLQSTGNIVLSAGGVLSFNAALPFEYASLSARVLTVGPANAGTGTSGSLRIVNDTSGFLYPGIYSTGNGISFATYGNGGLSNIAHARTYGLLAGRSVFSGVGNPGAVAVGSSNFDETIPNIAIKIGGNIGFTDGSLDGSSFVRPISATMGYNTTTNLISLSSKTNRVGFRFEPVEAGNNRPEIYSDGNLYITNNFGGGRRIYFNGSGNQLWNPFELGYNGAFAYGTIEITATQQPGTGYTWPYLKITQDVKQLSNFIQAVSSNGSTILSYSSAGVLNLNSRIFLKPDGLIQFTNTSSTTPAIKGTSTTVQARTGDDSQYTYLQGELQTDQAASAGTFTPDRYLILYDSTGTAYKVPVQAL